MKRLLVILFSATWGIAFTSAYNLYQINGTASFILCGLSFISLLIALFLLKSVEKEVATQAVKEAIKALDQFNQQKERER